MTSRTSTSSPCEHRAHAWHGIDPGAALQRERARALTRRWSCQPRRFRKWLARCARSPHFVCAVAAQRRLVRQPYHTTMQFSYGSGTTSRPADGVLPNVSRQNRLARSALLVPLLVACFHRSTTTCFPGGGLEVWIERHWRTEGSQLTPLRIELTPDSAGVPEMGWQTTVVVTDTLNANLKQLVIPNDGRFTMQLAPGTYIIHVRELKFVSVHRRVTLEAGERVDVHLQRQHSPYCLLPIVRTSL